MKLKVSPLGWLVVVFLVLCVTPVVQAPAAAVVYVIPLLAGLYLVRTYTLVDSRGITVSGLLRQVRLRWSEIDSVGTGVGGGVYAVLPDGSTLRLRGATAGDLTTITSFVPPGGA